MEFLTAATALLWIVTSLVAAGIICIWRVTRSPHLVLGLALIYYYSLAGAWNVIYLKSTGAADVALEHLEASLFPITVDENYLLTIAIYGIFIFALIVALRFFVTGNSPHSNLIPSLTTLPRVAHGRLLTIAVLALGFSIALIWGAILSALDSGVSAYSVSRSETDQYFTIHQLLNRIGLGATAIGLGICVLRPPRSWWWLSCYLLVALAWTLFLGILGNRSELLVAGIAGLLWCYSLGVRFGTFRTISVAVVAFVVFRLIEYTRGEGLEAITINLGELFSSADFWNPFALATGSESLAAHMSLYGVLSRDLDFTHGSSLLYLVNSLLPRILSSDRVADAYTTYATAVSAPDTQGFNIHYAAACYLNLGLAAVIVGAVIVAAVWGGLFRVLARKRSDNLLSYGPLLSAFCFCSAYVPVMMRGGPEGLKSLIVEGILIPYFLAWFALRQVDRSVPRTSIPAASDAAGH